MSAEQPAETEHLGYVGRWSLNTRCWRQPEMLWINTPQETASLRIRC